MSAGNRAVSGSLERWARGRQARHWLAKAVGGGAAPGCRRRCHGEGAPGKGARPVPASPCLTPALAPQEGGDGDGVPRRRGALRGHPGLLLAGGAGPVPHEALRGHGRRHPALPQRCVTRHAAPRPAPPPVRSLRPGPFLRGRPARPGPAGSAQPEQLLPPRRQVVSSRARSLPVGGHERLTRSQRRSRTFGPGFCPRRQALRPPGPRSRGGTDCRAPGPRSAQRPPGPRPAGRALWPSCSRNSRGVSSGGAERLLPLGAVPREARGAEQRAQETAWRAGPRVRCGGGRGGGRRTRVCTHSHSHTRLVPGAGGCSSRRPHGRQGEAAGQVVGTEAPYSVSSGQGGPPQGLGHSRPGGRSPCR